VGIPQGLSPFFPNEQPDTMTRSDLARLARASLDNGNILPADLYGMVFGERTPYSESETVRPSSMIIRFRFEIRTFLVIM